jgi:pimeloyl-ACP methyl ester carboxylesterase
VTRGASDAAHGARGPDDAAGAAGAVHRADVAGAPLAWEEWGAAPPDGDGTVLLVHGFPHGRWLWREAAAALVAPAPSAWRVLAPDLPGFGDSPPRPDAAPSLDAWADLLVALLDARGVRRAAVAGLSMGGYVALALWRRHPGRVRALVLADTRATADAPEARARRDALVALARSSGAAAVATTLLEGALGPATRADPARLARFAERLAGASVDGIVAGLLAMRDRPDATAVAAGITVPTLVVGGADDALTRPAELRALAAGIPGARLALLDGAGHASAWEAPGAFAEVARPVLRAVSAGRPTGE